MLGGAGVFGDHGTDPDHRIDDILAGNAVAGGKAGDGRNSRYQSRHHNRGKPPGPSGGGSVFWASLHERSFHGPSDEQGTHFIIAAVPDRRKWLVAMETLNQ